METFDPHPIVMWELTRACDLHCTHCSIAATEKRGTNELTTYEAYKTIDQIAALEPREVVITGGDPLVRDDMFQIIDYARRRGLKPEVVLSPTAGLTREAIERLARSGAAASVFRIDGFTPTQHAAVQGVVGTFASTLRAMNWAAGAEMKVEVDTLITRRNADHLAGIAALLRPANIARWNLYFLVPLTAAAQADMLLASEAERLFAVVDELCARESFEIRLIEAPHYRRFRLQRDRAEHVGAADAIGGAGDFVFISYAGDVRPSEFLHVSGGNLRKRSLGAIYRNSDLFVALRDADHFTGKCGRCEYRRTCGGSRARAWTVGGNIFGDDPLCVYEPSAPIPLPVIEAPKERHHD